MMRACLSTAVAWAVWCLFGQIARAAALGRAGGRRSGRREEHAIVPRIDHPISGATTEFSHSNAGRLSPATGELMRAARRGSEEQEWGHERQNRPELKLSKKSEESRPLIRPEDDEPGRMIEEMDEEWAEHASAPAPPGAVLANARAVYSDLSDEILSRWGQRYANTPLFSGGMKFSDGGKVVEDKFLDAVVAQRGFLASFTGVSTTAAHDCLYEQSYPVLLNETLGKLLGAAGVEFQAINVAMGNTRVAPYSWCVDAHAGLDADIISWDMTMMLGRNDCGRSAAGVELFIRSACVLPKRPAVLLTDASPNQDLCTDGHLRQVEKIDQGLSGGCIPDRDLFKVYRDFGLHQISPRSLVPKVTCGDDVFARARLYNNTEKDFPRPVGWHAGPTGHLLLGDMLFMHYADVFLKALERLDALRPGITAAGLRQQSLIYRGGANGLRKSLGLEVDSTSNASRVGGSRSGEASVSMGGGGGVILPPPSWCKGWRFCEWAGSYRCATTYFPLAGKEGSRLLDMVTESTPAVGNRNHSEHFVEPPEGSWAVTLNEEAMSIKEYLKASPPEGYHHPIDMKWVLVGDKGSGPIAFEFETFGTKMMRGSRKRLAAVVVEGGDEVEVVRSGETEGSTSDGQGDDAATTETAMKPKDKEAQFDSRITVCKPDFIDRVAFNESSEVRFSVDGVPVSTVELVQLGLHPQSCVLLDMEVGLGRHFLKVEPLRAGEPFVAISHVLYPA